MREYVKRQVERLGQISKALASIDPRRVNRALDFINGDFYFRKSIDRIGAIDKISQLQLIMAYQDRVRSGSPLPAFRDAEFRCFSQNGEDGILLLLLSVAGMETRRSVEMCAGDGVVCNTANLAIHHGFEALMLDGVPENVRRGRKYYDTLRDTRLCPPRMVEAWITRENVNDLCREHGFVGEIDVFSLDMDGVDYWIWKELNAVDPRVVVVEYNNLWPADKAMTVPYDEQFRTTYHKLGADYAGASLLAFAKLAREKGYRLVGCQQLCFNAFFLRNDVAVKEFPEVSVESCLTHPFAVHAMTERFPKIASSKWVEV